MKKDLVIAPAKTRQDCLKGSGRLGTKHARGYETINAIRQTYQSDRAWCASRHSAWCVQNPAFLVCIKRMTEWNCAEWLYTKQCISPCTWGRCMRHSLSSAAPRFNSLANYAVCIFPVIIISYDSTIKFGFKLTNMQLTGNTRPFILFVFDQSRKLTFSRLMMTSLFHIIFLSSFLLPLSLSLHILKNLWTEIWKQWIKVHWIMQTNFFCIAWWPLSYPVMLHSLH